MPGRDHLNSVWDWLHLLLVPFVLPIALAWFSATRLDRAGAQEQEPPLAVSPDTPAGAG